MREYFDLIQAYALRFWLWAMSLSQNEQIALCVALLVPLHAVLFIVKCVLIALLRRFGLSTPRLYSRIPTVPWRSALKLKMAWDRFIEQFKYTKIATGGFAGMLATLTLKHTRNTIFLGRVWLFGLGFFPQSVGIRLEKHLLMLAGTGSGKTSTVITIVSEYRGSAFVIDPTGLITKTLAPFDKKRDWVLFQPYSDTTAQLNPFDDIKAAIKREGSPNMAVKWAFRIAECFITAPPDARNIYFYDVSKNMLAATILHVLSAHPEEEHSLPVVYELLVHGYRVYNDDGSLESTAEESQKLLHKNMLENPAFDGAISCGAAYINASAETRANLESTLLDKLKVLSIPQVRHFFAKTTRPLSDLKTRDDVVFSLDVPLYSIRQELQSVVKLLQSLVCYTFESVKEKRGNALLVADEQQACGYSQALEVCLPTSRSQGLYVIVISQDLEGLKASFPKSYMSFIGNAQAVLWMGTAHPMNLKQLSEMLGKKTLVQHSRDGQAFYRDVPVMTEEQLARFLAPERGNFIATRNGQRPLRLKIDPYFKSLPVWRYAPDPDHKEALLKRLTRLLIRPSVSQKPLHRHVGSKTSLSTNTINPSSQEHSDD